VLHAIYEIRQNEQNIDQVEVEKLEHSLAMVHFLGKQIDLVIFEIVQIRQLQSMIIDYPKP
jgi:hypothetical protein